MNLQQLERKQAAVIAPVLIATQTAVENYKGVPIAEATWVALLRLLFELMRPAAWEVAGNAREFYDSERARHFPGVGRQEVNRQTINFGRFVKDMEQHKDRFLSGDSDDGDVTRVKLQVARTVENVGRRTIIRAVEDPDPELAKHLEENDDYKVFDSDDDPTDEYTNGDLSNAHRRRKNPKQRVVKGWARMATGRETCGWCWMLVSRGPAYSSMEAAGFRGSFADAMKVYRGGNFDAAELMNQWHPGCDCKVVPVFNLQSYPGKERTDAAWELWGDVVNDKGLSGKQAISAYTKAVREGLLGDYLNSAVKAA